MGILILSEIGFLLTYLCYLKLSSIIMSISAPECIVFIALTSTSHKSASINKKKGISLGYRALLISNAEQPLFWEICKKPKIVRPCEKWLIGSNWY